VVRLLDRGCSFLATETQSSYTERIPQQQQQQQ
jgi:hypothetical protein